MVKVMHTIIDPYIEEDFSKEELCNRISAIIYYNARFVPVRNAHIILLNDLGEILNNWYIRKDVEEPQRIDYVWRANNLCFDYEIIKKYSFFEFLV